MPLRKIVLPETKPETEWVRGRPLQKVSSTRLGCEMLGQRDVLALAAMPGLTLDLESLFERDQASSA